MIKRRRIELTVGQTGDNVAVLIPMVDRGRGEPRKYTVNRNNSDQYPIAKKTVILNGTYSRNHFVI